MSETKHTFCRICEALCGLEVDVEGERVVAIRPDPRHVASRGFACVKGLNQHHLYDSPDRLLYPLKRVDGRHVRVSWAQALTEIGAKLRALRAGPGPDSIAMYVGTAAGFGVLHPVFASGFMQGLGSKSLYSSATQDCANKFAVAQHVYGFCFTQPFPDLDRTNCLIVVGANPAVSKWSFLQVPAPIAALKQLEARGARLFVVDPRRTETAKTAGEHVFIRPGTDVWFYLAFLHELVRTGGVARARVAAHMRGLDEVLALVEAWPPERAAAVTQIPAEKLREMVAAYRQADGAALYCSTGVNMGGNGSLAFWLQEVINAVSGNLDRIGGTLVGRGIIDFPRFGKRFGVLTSTARSRVGGFAAVNDGFPGGLLADEILTPGDRQVRALVVTGGNPLLTMPNSERLRTAFEKLELLVCLDIQMSETASQADYVLPCTSPLQRPDLPFLFPLMLGLQRAPYLQATRAVVPPQGEQRDEASIYVDLARAAGAPIFGSRVAQRAFEVLRWRHGRKHPGGQPALPQEQLLDLLLRLSGNQGFSRLHDARHGRLRAPHAGEDFLGSRVTTDDGKVNLAPAPLLQQARERLEEDYAGELSRKDQLKLITRRAVTTHNSWTHNHAPFVAGDRGTNYLYMHPLDMAARGLAEGVMVDVRTETAAVRVPVRALADLMPGTAALPHGWGHQRAGQTVARETRGVNVNLLAADGPERLERVSGMARLTGIPIEVQAASGPQDASDWSGLPPELRG